MMKNTFIKKLLAVALCVITIASVPCMPVSGAWVKNSDKTWSYTQNGEKLSNGWKLIGGKWYFFDAKGVMKTGWVKHNGTWYYLLADGAMAQSQWVLSWGAWFYLDADGAMHTGWLEYKGDWYLLAPNGEMYRGWAKVGEQWYYLHPQTGAMLYGWQMYKGEWYWLNTVYGDMRENDVIDNWHIGPDGIAKELTSKDMWINTPQTVSNKSVKGSFYTAKKLAKDSAVLNNVKIDGNLVVYGGGMGTPAKGGVHLTNGTTAKGLVVLQEWNDVRITFETLPTVSILEGCFDVYLNGRTDSFETYSKNKVVWEGGYVGKGKVTGAGDELIINRGVTFDDLEVATSADGAKVNIEGHVNTLHVNGDNTIVEGAGDASVIYVNADNVQINLNKGYIVVAPGVTGTTINGRPVKGGEQTSFVGDTFGGGEAIGGSTEPRTVKVTSFKWYNAVSDTFEEVPRTGPDNQYFVLDPDDLWYKVTVTTTGFNDGTYDYVIDYTPPAGWESYWASQPYGSHRTGSIGVASNSVARGVTLPIHPCDGIHRFFASLDGISTSVTCHVENYK